MMRFLLSLIIGHVCFFWVNSQSFDISGSIINNNNEAIPFANVLVLRASDSTLVKGGLSDDNGKFKFSSISTNSYFIKASMIGFQPVDSEVFLLNKNITLKPLVMAEGEELEEVFIEASKPLYQQKVDRMVINVESSIVSSGGTALEILERSPGVTVNRQNNNISLVGKSGVVVMINDKISYMPTSALVQMLEGMSANNIETIELITTPPANFDAEGNAGYINIKLKQRTDLGLNGSYSFSLGYGKGITNSDNINFNYRKNKVNIYGNYSINIDQREQVFKTSREYESEGNLFGSETFTFRDPNPRNQNLRLGIDFEVNEKLVMGIILNGLNNRWSMDAINENVDTENGIPTQFVNLDNTEINHLKHFGANYNIKYNFNKEEYLIFDANYLYFVFDNPTTYVNTFFDENMEFVNKEELRSGKETPITTLVGQIDYSKKLSDKFKGDFGFKLTNSTFENDVIVENLVNNIWIPDPTLTNISELNETYFAAYTSIDINIDDKTSLKAGLRYEFTDSKLDTDTQGIVVDREYGIWFPSIFINRKWSDDLSMNISYTKRITRPTFNDLAPFVIFFDPNTFISGNASLQPAISNSVKYDLNYKSYFLSFQYTNEDATIARFQERIDEETGRLIFEAENLDYTRTFSATLGFPLKLTKWWRIQNNVIFININNRAFYDDIPVQQKVTNFSANSTNSFKYNNSLSAELVIDYTGPRLFGAAQFDEILSFNFGLQYKLSEKWGTLKFSINDIFDQVRWNTSTNLPQQNIRTDNYFDFFNRTFTLTYSRNFGNSKLKSARDRNTAAEDERQRVN